MFEFTLFSMFTIQFTLFVLLLAYVGLRILAIYGWAALTYLNAMFDRMQDSGMKAEGRGDYTRLATPRITTPRPRNVRPGAVMNPKRRLTVDELAEVFSPYEHRR